jgi:hypothetical protein
MIGELITLPVRLSARAARLALRGGLQTSGRALELVSYVVKSVTPDLSGNGSEWTAPTDAETPTDVRVEAERVSDPPSQPSAEPPPEPASEPAPLHDEPTHVSEEPILVDELAEPGAEEGAGAEVTVAEPWDGYAQMTAKDVVARLSDATPAELAAVQLYESANRHRDPVMSAVRRELATKSGGRAAAADQVRKEQANGGSKDLERT